jgi:hypothetical protein
LVCADEELRDALNGQPQPLRRRRLNLYLGGLNLIEGQIAELEAMIAEAMTAHQDGVVRLSELPGLRATTIPRHSVKDSRGHTLQVIAWALISIL